VRFGFFFFFLRSQREIGLRYPDCGSARQGSTWERRGTNCRCKCREALRGRQLPGGIGARQSGVHILTVHTSNLEVQSNIRCVASPQLISIWTSHSGTTSSCSASSAYLAVLATKSRRSHQLICAQLALHCNLQLFKHAPVPGASYCTHHMCQRASSNVMIHLSMKLRAAVS
jgi:hypothetical protein